MIPIKNYVLSENKHLIQESNNNKNNTTKPQSLDVVC